MDQKLSFLDVSKHHRAKEERAVTEKLSSAELLVLPKIYS